MRRWGLRSTIGISDKGGGTEKEGRSIVSSSTMEEEESCRDEEDDTGKKKRVWGLLIHFEKAPFGLKRHSIIYTFLTSKP